jgi:DNA repair protein RadC
MKTQSETLKNFKKMATFQAQLNSIREEMNKYFPMAKKADLPLIMDPNMCWTILRPFMEHLEQEELWILDLDTRNRVLHMGQIYKGSMTSAMVRVGELFRHAIVQGAISIIVAHNHPSGDPTPSPDDISLTRGIVQAGKLLDITVLDHIIIGSDRFKSLKEGGLGF